MTRGLRPREGLSTATLNLDRNRWTVIGPSSLKDTRVIRKDINLSALVIVRPIFGS